MLDMKVIFTEGSVHHLKTMEMHTAPRVGEKVVVDNKLWTVDQVVHLPKVNGLNENESYSGYDDRRDADMTVHLNDGY